MTMEHVEISDALAEKLSAAGIGSMADLYDTEKMAALELTRDDAREILRALGKTGERSIVLTVPAEQLALGSILATSEQLAQVLGLLTACCNKLAALLADLQGLP